MATELIRIPSERADQLRALAAHKQTTMSALIGGIIDGELDRLGLTRAIGLGKPVDIAELEDGTIHFSYGNLGTFNWSRTVVADVADTLREMTDPGRVAANLNVDASLEIRRKGNGVILKHIENGNTVALATPVAAALGKVLASYAN